jgi:phospholipid/cholesterol/gamma-HCH transport system substrate-binding protein
MVLGPNRLAAVGAFVVGGMVLFAVGLFLIGNRRMLFGERFHVYAEFATIAGLENGSLVRVAGLDAGEVEAIHLPTSPSAPFRVRMRVRSDVRPLIRFDSVAAIQTDGLVGNKFVRIEAGSEESPIVDDEGTIKSREPFDMADLLLRMSHTVEIANDTIIDVKGRLDEALNAVSETANTAQVLMEDVGRDVRVIMASAQRITSNLQTMVADVRAGRGTVGQLVNDETLYQNIRNIAEQAERTMANVRQASAEARAAIAEVRGEDGPVKGVTADLQQTLAAAREAMTNLAENTEALKRNFLFRGFFNRRGYFSLDDLTVQQYRAGALATDNRRPLRVWIATDVLFERGANERERLSDGGRARLDSAMSHFVRYPTKSPFVVEGYAQELTADARFLVSRSRAVMVRDYLVGKYGLDPTLVATMPMGAEAEGSPAGPTWDGIALALFVPR